MENKPTFIVVPTVYRDGSVLNCVVDELIDTQEISIQGVLTKKAWDPVNYKFVQATGLFIDYKGIEYGVVMSLDDFLSAIGGLCCIENEFRLFDIEFDFEFE